MLRKICVLIVCANSKITKVFCKFTAQKMKFFNKDFFSKWGQIRSFLRIWSHLLKKSLMKYFFFHVVFASLL